MTDTVDSGCAGTEKLLQIRVSESVSTIFTDHSRLFVSELVVSVSFPVMSFTGSPVMCPWLFHVPMFSCIWDTAMSTL